MMTDFHDHRRQLTPGDGGPPEPKGWNPDGTHTGNPSRHPGADPFDCAPSRNPYPSRLPTLAGSPPATHHMALLHHYSKRMLEERILLEGGEEAVPPTLRRGPEWRRAELRQAILRRKAILEELGTGVVLLTAQEQAEIDLGGEPDAAAA